MFLNHADIKVIIIIIIRPWCVGYKFQNTICDSAVLHVFATEIKVHVVRCIRAIYFHNFQVIDFAEKKLQEQQRPTNTEEPTSDGFPYDTLTTWQGIIETSTDNPALVLELLLDANMHTAARKWVDWYLQGEKEEEFGQLIDQSELCYLLRKEDNGYSEAFRVSA